MDRLDRLPAAAAATPAIQVLSAEKLGVLAAEGAAMSLDEVVAYALGTAGGVPPTAHAEVGS